MCVEEFLIVALLSAISPRTVLGQGDSRSSRTKDLQPRFASFETAPRGRFPYMCSLRFNADRSKHACGGILIHPLWILTAAHCVDPMHPGSTGLVPIAYCGIHDIADDSDDLVFATVEGIMHDDWDRDFFKGNDIAMLKLDREASVTLPRLNVPNSRPEPGRPLDGLGWGETSGGKEATKLQLAENLIAVSNSLCNQRWGGKLNEERVLCAGIGENDACKGDSGGPLLHADSPDGSVKKGNPRFDLIVGIVSAGDGPCGQSTEPGVYTDVGYYSEWIQSVINGTDQGNGPGTPGVGPMASAVVPEGDDSAPPSDPEMDLEEIFDSPLDMSDPTDTEPTKGQTPSSAGSTGSPEPDPCTTYLKLADVVAAIEDDDSAAVRTALDCGLDPDSRYSGDRSSTDLTLLHWAARYNSSDSAKALIEFGADVEATISSDYTPLHYCGFYGSASVAKVLIDNKASVNAKGRSRLRPLHLASREGHVDVVKLLLDSGADVDAIDDFGETALHKASSNGHADVVKTLLFAGSDPNAVISNGDAALNFAVLHGFVGVVELLLEHGADANVAGSNGRTPLQEASYGGASPKIVKALLDGGAKIDAKDETGTTALHFASGSGHNKVVEVLIKEGAAVDVKDDNGETPLHAAAANGHADSVEILVEAGANLSAKNVTGETPLHEAAERGNLDVVAVLVEAGASKTAVDDDGNRPEDLICRWPFHECTPATRLAIENLLAP